MSISLNSQNIDTYLSYIKKYEYQNAIDFSNKGNDMFLKNYAELLYYSGERDSTYFLNKKYDTKLNIKEKESFEFLLKGHIESLYKKNSLTAFKFYYQALEKAKEIKSSSLIKESLISILNVYRNEIFFGNKQYAIYLKELKNLENDKIDSFLIAFYNLVFYTKTIYDLDDKFYSYIKKIDSIYSLNKFNSFLSAIYYNEKGLEKRIVSKPKESIKFYKKSFSFLNNDIPFHKSTIYGLNLNLGKLYLSLGDKKNAKKHFTSAKYHSLNSKYKTFFYDRYISDYFDSIKKYDSAYFHIKRSLSIEYDLNYKSNSLEISQLNKLYQTEKKEKENLILKQINTQNRNFLYGSLIFIGFGGIITYLIINNSRRKREFAEQQKELEKQKNIALIKEQEITTINAMIDGQEKERVRIAEDLHDNIGSVLATLKLHFENLKLNREKKHFNQEELYEKTEDLIDETYKKVRNIAHAKNAGVIANQGLLDAIKIMAEKISSANKTKIDVLDFGLNKRLENNLEITIFRIIQELTTNIIKHAEANNATINISQFDNILNIIIEDDGKGFNCKKINLKNGMGLNSIKTRIEHLNGTFDIDTTINKGTNIILNIPLS